jgi:lysozyme
MAQGSFNRDLAIKIATDFIAKEETLYKVLPDGRVQSYWDKYGKIWTIGWGNTYYEDGSSVKEGDIITKDRAKRLLDFVVRQKEAAIRPYIKVYLNENQYAALLSLVYNCGEGNTRRSELLDLINSGADPATIADQYDETCITAKGVYVAGLYNRRMREIKLFFTSVRKTIMDNPRTSIAIAVIVMSMTGYLAYRLAKTKK